MWSIDTAVMHPIVDSLYPSVLSVRMSGVETRDARVCCPLLPASLLIKVFISHLSGYRGQDCLVACETPMVHEWC
jgi:hypothetical protein